MLIKLTNTINSIVRRGLSIVRNGLKMWLPFSKSEVLGEEKSVRGDFPEESDGTLTSSSYDLGFATPSSSVGSVVTINDGKLTILNQASSGSDRGKLEFSNLSLDGKFLPEIGKTYKLTYNIDGVVGNPVLTLYKGDGYATDLTENIGDNTYIFTPTNNINFLLRNSSDDTTVVFNSISLKEVTQIAPDKSGNSNSAKLFTGKALSFDGVNDYVDFGSDINSNGTVWTTAIWIGDYTAGSYDWIYGDTTQQSIGLSYGSVQNTVFYRDLYGTFVEFSCDAFKSDFTNAKRLVFTSDGTDISLYIDGEFIDSITPTSTVLKLSRLMAGYDTTSYMVAATVSDFQLYNTAWTQADVTFDYNNPQHLVTDNSESTIALNNLKGYWHLSEGDGSIVYDSSGEGNDGTIIGATWDDQQSTIPQLGLMDWSKGSNLIEYSEKMSEYDSGVTVVDNSTTNPNGVTNASKITKSGASANDRIDITNTTLVNGDVYNISAFIKNDDVNGKTTLGVRIASGTLFRQGYEWDGSTLSLSSTFASGTRTNVLLEDIGNGWWKIGYSFTSDGTNSDIEIDLDRMYQSDTTSLFLWGIQLNEGSSATAYRRTNGTAVTDATLIADPNDPSEDILGNSVRLREHSLNLDGIGYAEVPDADNLDFGTGDFTLEAWVVHKFENTDSNYNSILSLGNAFNSTDSASLVSNIDRFRMYIGTTNVNVGALITGQWYHIVGVRESGVMRIYLNSIDKANKPASGNVTNSDFKRVGKDNTANRYYKDLIDEPRLYNRALTQKEITQNFKAGLNKHKASSSFSDDFSSDYGF